MHENSNIVPLPSSYTYNSCDRHGFIVRNKTFSPHLPLSPVPSDRTSWSEIGPFHHGTGGGGKCGENVLFLTMKSCHLFYQSCYKYSWMKVALYLNFHALSIQKHA